MTPIIWFLMTAAIVHTRIGENVALNQRLLKVFLHISLIMSLGGRFRVGLPMHRYILFLLLIVFLLCPTIYEFLLLDYPYNNNTNNYNFCQAK